MRIPERMTRAPLRTLTILTLLGALLWLGPLYSTNDDVAFAFLSTGVVLSDAPTSMLVFVHPWYAAVIVWLARVTHVQAWGVVQFAIMFAVLSTWVLLCARRGWQHVWFWGPVLLIGLLPHCLALQFTTTGILAAFTGACLLAHAETTTTQRTAGVWVAGLTLIFLGASLRINAGLLGTGLGGLTLLPQLFKGQWKVAIARGAVLASALLLIKGLSLVHETTYANARGWAEFQQVNRAAGLFVARGAIRYNATTAPIFSRHGWSENDFNMMTMWASFDPTVFSAAKLDAIEKETRAVGRAPQDRTWTTLAAVVRDDSLLQTLALLWGCLLIVAGISSSGSTRAVGLVTVGLGLYVFTSAHFNYYLPGHVSHPICVAAILSLTLVLLSDEKFLSRQLPRRALPYVLAIFGFMQLRDFATKLDAYERVSTEARRTFDAYNTDPTRIYLRLVAPFSSDYLVEPFADLSSYADWNVIDVGWPARTPNMQRRLRQLGIDDVMLATVKDPRVAVLALPEQLEVLRRFLAEHHGLQAEFKRDPKLPNTYIGSVR